MPRISLKHIEAFVQVADLASFRRAADQLNTTQPNISTRIAGLEAQVGTKLFERDAGSVRLTLAGQRLLSHARGITRAVEGFIQACDLDHLYEGTLRLGVTEIIVHSWLSDYLAALKSRFPKIDVDVTVDVSTEISAALHSRNIDLALQNGPFNRTTSGAEDLGAFPVVWVASPALDIDKPVLSWADVARRPIISHAKGTLPYQQLTEHIARHSDVSVNLMTSSNLAACLQMTLDGLGVACLPERLVRDALRGGRLVRLRYLWVPDALHFFARYDADIATAVVGEAARLAASIAQEQDARI